MSSSGQSFEGMTPYEAREHAILPFTVSKDFSTSLHLKQSGSSFSVLALVNIPQIKHAPLPFLEPHSKHQHAVKVWLKQTCHASWAGFSFVQKFGLD